MATIGVFIVVNKENIHFLEENLGNLSSFDSKYICLNDLDLKLTFSLTKFENTAFIKTDNLSLDECYKKLLNICNTDYFCLLSVNHITHGEIRKYLNKELNKGYNLIYTDEGYIDGDNVSFYYKPDFDKELLYCQNYINRFAIYKTDLVKSLNVFNNQLNYNSDWALALEVTHNVHPNTIKHIPESLIAIKNNSYSNSLPYLNGDNYKFIKLVEKYIKETQRSADVVVKNNYLLPKYKVDDEPLVTIVILTKDKVNYLKKCIDSIRDYTTYKNYEIVVVNNNSEENDTIEYLNKINECDKITVMNYPYPFDFAKMHNVVINQLESEFFCLLNNDTAVIDPDWLTEMVGIALDSNVGAVGAKLVYEDMTIQHAGVVVGVGGLANHLYVHKDSSSEGYWNTLQLQRNCTAVTGACLLIRKSHYIKVGMMDENLPINYNDVDLCMRLRKIGLRNVWTPNARLYHYESKSRGSSLDPDKIVAFSNDHAYMRYKHGKEMYSDPYYNEHFTYTKTDYSVGNPNPYRKLYSKDLYVLPIPYGIEGLNKVWLPTPSKNVLTAALRLPLGINAKLKGISIPIHQHQIENMISKFSIKLKFPNEENIYENTAVTNNGNNVTFWFTDLDKVITDLDKITMSLELLASNSYVHLNWFYGSNKHSMYVESLPNKQFMVNLILQDI